MANLFNIPYLASSIAAGKDKAVALAGQFALNGLTGGRVLPPLPPFVTNGDDAMRTGLNYKTTAESIAVPEASGIFGVPMCFPVWLKPESWPVSQEWLIPTEPMITIGGGNALVKRSVARQAANRHGTVKERWAVDDYSISITGILTKIDDWTYPKDDVIKLREICEAREPVEIRCDLLLHFGIKRMVIEKYDFPFTKGEENQAYTISALSDSEWDLFIKVEN